MHYKKTKTYNSFIKSKYLSLKWKNYFYIYDKLFEKYRNKKIIFVEIGVFSGGSLFMWRNFFGKQAYLAQSPQLYKEQMTIGLERVFEIASFYRAEKSHTGRHLSEFTSVDLEAAFMDYTDVMNVLENLVLNTFKYVSENCTEEQKIIGNEIVVPNNPFKKITYSQALDELNGKDAKLEFGNDLLDSHLRILGESHPEFYFITDWPLKLKPFYIMEKEDDPNLSESFDLQYGYLELSSGGTRLHNTEKIKARLSEQNLDPTKFSEHLQAFGWGMPPHAGWGLGLERLLTVILGIDNVREVILYPRDPERLKPRDNFLSKFHSCFISTSIFCFNIIFYNIIHSTL